MPDSCKACGASVGIRNIPTPSRSAYPFADRESRGGTGEFLPAGVAPSHCERSA